MLEGRRAILLLKEASLRKAVAESLARVGAFAYPYKKTDDFLKSLTKDHPHFAWLDDKVAEEDNFRLIKKIRDHATCGSLPILVLSPSVALSVRKKFIEAGADRVLRSKAEPDSLILDTFALLRRSQSFQKDKAELQFGDITLNPQRQQIRLSGKEIKLTSIEFKVFQELLSKRGEVVSREVLSQSFLSLRNSSDRTLDVHINALRRKLGNQGHNLTTIRGRGYLFRE